MIKCNVLLLLIFLVSACAQKSTSSPADSTANKPDVSPNQPSRTQSDLSRSILEKGEKAAYEELYIAYLDNYCPEEFLLYALIMANKYDYPQAYFDTYLCLVDVYRSNLSNIDQRTAEMAIDYLFMASRKGHHQANEIVKQHAIVIDAKVSDCKALIMEIEK